MVLTLAEVPPWVTAAAVVFFLFLCIGMILVVLIQRPQGGGLGGAFGGAGGGSGQTAFGARTGDFLTLVTIGCFLAYLTTASVLNFIVEPPTVRETPQLTPAGAPEPQPAQTQPEQAAPPQRDDAPPPPDDDAPAAPDEEPTSPPDPSGG